MATFILLSVLIGACVAINPVSLSGNIEEHVAREQLSKVVMLERPPGASLPSSARDRHTRSASTHTVNSTTFTLAGDRHQYGRVFYSGAGSSVSVRIRSSDRPGWAFTTFDFL